jgi:hypothetical protein
MSEAARAITAIERGEVREQDVAEFLLNGFVGPSSKNARSSTGKRKWHSFSPSPNHEITVRAHRLCDTLVSLQSESRRCDQWRLFRRAR